MWTKQERKILKDCLKRNATILGASREASTMMDRSVIAVRNYYYEHSSDFKRPNNYSRYSEEELRLIIDTAKKTKTVSEAVEILSKNSKRTKRALANIIYRKIKEGEDISTSSKIRESRLKDIKKVLIEEVSANPDNLKKAFRNVSEKTGLSESTISLYWYDKKLRHFGLYRKDMPALFYRVGKLGTSANEKNSNVIKVSKGKYIFSLIFSKLKIRKPKVKDKK